MMGLRIVTWNIRLGIQQGLECVADVLAALDPELVALQEVGDHWKMGPGADTTAILAERLGMPHFRHVVAIDEPPHRYGTALLCRWPMGDAEVICLPQVIDEPRRLLRCRVEAPEGALEVFSTHLSHLAPERPAQGELLADLAIRSAQHGHPVVVLGDLNEPDRPTWMERLLNGFEDADGAQRRATYPARAPTDRIDYLLAAGARWRDVEVVAESEASDHRPVVADLIPG